MKEAITKPRKKNGINAPARIILMTSCDVKAGKPAPDVYLEAAKLLNLNPCDCVVFEDIPAGIMAGKAAGMTVFAVEDEFSEPLREKKLALADGWVRDYTDFI